MMNWMSDVKNAQERPGVEPAWDRKQPAWYEMRPGGTSGEPSGISGADWLLYGAIAAVSLGIGVVNALSAAQDAVWRGGAYDVRTRLFWEMSSIVTIILLAPLLFVAVRRMRHASGWLLRVALAASAIFVFSALHIAGMVGLRKIVMFLAGGSYDFHFSVATLVYEFRKDVITCLLIGGSLWLIDSRRQAQLSRSVPADVPSPAPHMVWLRDGSARIRIEPRDILWISSAGNYVEYSLDGGRTHLVRGTLAGEEARLTKFNIVRVHRTRLVNLSRVTGLRAGLNGDFELTLDAGQAIAGSRRYRGAVTSIEALASAPASVSNGNDAHP
jgi:LytTr DNA-binding domain